MKQPAFVYHRGDTDHAPGRCPGRHGDGLILRLFITFAWLAVLLPGQGNALGTCAQHSCSSPCSCTPAIAVDGVPLYLLKGAAPNLLMTLDTSKTMLWGGTHLDSDADAREVSSATNPVYYAPEITYLPPKRPDGSSYDPVRFDHAPADFFRDQFCTFCEDDRLEMGALSKLGNCRSLCPAPTGCHRKLSEEYAAVNEDTNPCAPVSVSGRGIGAIATLPGAYVRDPDYSKMIGTISPAPATGTQWAMMCMYQTLSNGTKLTNHSAVACPAYYYRVLTNEYTYSFTPENGITQQKTQPCTTEMPAWRGQEAEDSPGNTQVQSFITNCLQRVIVGTREDSRTPGGDTVGGDIANTSDAALADRAARLVDCPPTGDADADADIRLAKCNFANWYAFYRTRWRTLQSVVTRALADLNPSARVGYQGLLETQYAAGDDYYKDQLLKPFGAFSTDRREWFQDWLFATQPTYVYTPLIESALRVLNFCKSDQAYVEPTNNALSACRNNFHLLFTDGAWDAPTGVNLDWLGNYDGRTQTLPTSAATGTSNPDALATKIEITEYTLNTQTKIYADGNSNALADIVFYSWITDLRPETDLVRTRLPTAFSLADTAPEQQQAIYWDPDWDPADWQHITTYTVGFGLQGKVTPVLIPPTPPVLLDKTKRGVYPLNSDAQKNLVADGFPPWGFPDAEEIAAKVPDDQDKVDDLWHAAIDGRGDYWSANNPEALIIGFQGVVDAVNEMTDQRIAAATAPAINTGGAAAPRIVFQAVLDIGTWTGDLRAFRISSGPGLPPCADKNRAKGDFCEDPTPAPTVADPWKTKEPPYWSAADHLARPPAPAGIIPKVWPNRTIVTGTRMAAGPTGVAFAFSNLAPADQAELLKDMDVAGLSDTKKASAATAVMNFIAGDATNEDLHVDNLWTFRKRSSVLGDIINSTPVVVSAPHRNYEATAGEGDYPAWAAANQDRKDVVYVGANDGLLHAFATGTGESDDTGGGTELFAYVPRPLFSKLYRLTKEDYGATTAHTSFVDGPIAEGDVYTNGSWKSVLVGALGRGTGTRTGTQGVYAIRSPDNPGATNEIAQVHLWDFTDHDHDESDPGNVDQNNVDKFDMGYVLGKPTIARVLNSDGTSTRWVAIFGNGVNSSEDDGYRAAGCTDAAADQVATTTCGQAVLYVVDMENSGTVLNFAKFTTGMGIKDDPRHDGSTDDPREPNGLAQPTVLARVLVDADGNPIAGGRLIATAAYAGDLFGNLWRFDLMKLDFNQRTRTGTRIFTATDQDIPANPQPITAPVVLAPHPTGVGTIVLFGTGRYLVSGKDPADTSVQTFYGIWDRVAEPTDTTGARTAAITASELQSQYFKKEYAVSSADGTTVSHGRTSTRVNFAWAADPTDVKSGERMGWRIDLGASNLTPAAVDAAAVANAPLAIVETGERVVVIPQMRGERVVFVSLVPETNVCKGGGYGWINTLAYATGSALDYSPYDYNQDGIFDSKDLLKTGTDTSEAGASIRLEGGGVYSATAALPIGAAGSKVLVSDSKGKLVELLESSAMQWRVWRQVR